MNGVNKGSASKCCSLINPREEVFGALGGAHWCMHQWFPRHCKLWCESLSWHWHHRMGHANWFSLSNLSLIFFYCLQFETSLLFEIQYFIINLQIVLFNLVLFRTALHMKKKLLICKMKRSYLISFDLYIGRLTCGWRHKRRKLYNSPVLGSQSVAGYPHEPQPLG